MIHKLKEIIKESLLFKLFIGVLMLSVAVSRIGDFLNPGMDPSIVVRVHESEVSTVEFERQFKFNLERIQKAMGKGGMSDDEARRMAHQAALGSVTHTATMGALSKDFGFDVTEDKLRVEIRNYPSFKDESGAFNQLIYSQVLAENGLTEQGFLQLLQTDLRRDLLYYPVDANLRVPSELVGALTTYRGETRVADTILLSADGMSMPPDPTKEELQKIYDDNIGTFTAPEYRKIAAVVLRATDFAPPDSFDIAEVRKFYEDNISRYSEPEKRTIAQLVFEFKEEAEKVLANLAPGDSLTDLAREAGIQAPVDLGQLRPGDALSEMIGDAYNLQVGQISAPVETDVGWHLFEVRSIVHEQRVPMASVEGNIRKALAEEKGLDTLYEASTDLDDAIAGGLQPDDMAAAVGGRVVWIEALDRKGLNPHGLQASGLFDNEQFLDAAFSTPAGHTSPLVSLWATYYAVFVEEITPSAPRPLEDARGKVMALWEKDLRSKIATELAEKTAADIGPSSDLAKIARKNKSMSYAQLGPLTRFGSGLSTQHLIDSNRVSTELLEKLFTANPGNVVTASVPHGATVARLREIIPPSNFGDAARLRKEISTVLQDTLSDDIKAQMSSAFAERYPAQVNEKAVKNVTGIGS